MTRRQTTAAGPRGACATLLLSLTLCGCSTRPAEPRNLLVISIDTLRADHLGAYGYGKPTSPGIDAFAKNGWVFERAYGSSSWTLPSLSTLFTGQPMSSHGARTNTTPLVESWTTLAEHLSRAGFQTAAVVNHIYLARDFGLHQGFVDYDDELVMQEGKDSHLAVTSPTVTEKGLAWLEENGRDEEQRWFLWLHYFDPHSQYKKHDGLTERFGDPDDQVVRYDGEIAYTDLALADLFAGLEDLGVGRDTIIVLVADHGEAFGEHGVQGHRNDLYEESVRVPMVFAGPGVPSGRDTTPVGMADVFPTVYELLDLAPPEDLFGQSLAPLMRGEPLEHPGVVSELGATGVPRQATLVQDRWKLIVDRKSDTKELYDLLADPGEKRNLAKKARKQVRVMSKTLNAMTEIAVRRMQRKQAKEIELDEEMREALDNLGYMGGDED